MRKEWLVLFLVFSVSRLFGEGLSNREQEQLESYFPGHEIVSQTEGNFTGSGYREVLCLYHDTQRRGVSKIGKAVCFVIPGGDRGSIKPYEIPYSSGAYLYDSSIVILEGLGKRIDYKGYRFGYACDLNGNGRDEVYLPGYGGNGTFLLFFEYDPDTDQFESIIESGNYPNTYIEKYDTESGLLILKDSRRDWPPFTRLRWDEGTKMYVEVETEAE
ncbi:MAG: hypothetical protein LBQ14_00080 [Treponema sp.]|nr:hypothetical protein [Treponema sp.]